MEIRVNLCQTAFHPSNYQMKKILQFTCTGIAVLFANTSIFAQNQSETTTPIPMQTKIDFTLEGMIAVSVGDGIAGINVGGPSLKLKINDFKIGVGAFPSLIIMDDKAAPRLAVSPILEYKKWMLTTPYYGYDSNDRMIWTFGFGYKFR